MDRLKRKLPVARSETTSLGDAVAAVPGAEERARHEAAA
jgi:hypothetical protein